MAAMIPLSNDFKSFVDLKLSRPASVVPFFEATVDINSSRVKEPFEEIPTPFNKVTNNIFRHFTISVA